MRRHGHWASRTIETEQRCRMHRTEVHPEKRPRSVRLEMTGRLHVGGRVDHRIFLERIGPIKVESHLLRAGLGCRKFEFRPTAERNGYGIGDVDPAHRPDEEGRVQGEGRVREKIASGGEIPQRFALRRDVRIERVLLPRCDSQRIGLVLGDHALQFRAALFLQGLEVLHVQSRFLQESGQHLFRRFAAFLESGTLTTQSLTLRPQFLTSPMMDFH